MTAATLSEHHSRVLCLGMDPMPKSGLLKDWLECYENHLDLFDRLSNKPQWVKINLAFFIRWGRLGMDKLEHACETLSGQTNILLDGKFGEIGNSLNQYLDFAFEHLKVEGVTVNPFMGEHVMGSALQKAVALRGAKARVFVLAATSEFPQHKLSAFQHAYTAIAGACEEIHLALDPSGSLTSQLGMVVGANRIDALSDSELKRSSFPLLIPGVGAQGVTLSDAFQRTLEMKREIIFPVSRAICEGGNITAVEMQQRFESMQSEIEILTSRFRREP